MTVPARVKASRHRARPARGPEDRGEAGQDRPRWVHWHRSRNRRATRPPAQRAPWRAARTDQDSGPAEEESRPL